MRSRVNSRSARRLAPSARRARSAGSSIRRPNRGAERRGVAGLHDEAADAVLVHPRHAGRQVRADDRKAGRHRFHLHDAERFGLGDRRQREQIARAIVGRQVVVGHVAGEPDAIGQAERRGAGRERRLERPVADEDERPRTADHRVHEHVDALVVHETPDEQDARSGHLRAEALGERLARGVEAAVAVDVDAERNDGHAPGVPDETRRGRQIRARYDHAVRPPIERALDAAVGLRRPPRTKQIAVMPDDQPRRRRVEEERGAGDRVRFVQHDAVGARSPDP